MVATRLECSKYGNPRRPAWLGLRVAVRMKIYRIVVVLSEDPDSAQPEDEEEDEHDRTTRATGR